MNLNLKQRIKSVYFWMWTFLIISGIFAILFGITDNRTFYTLMLISWIYPILLAIVGIVYAWILWPIKSLIAWIKKRREE